MPEEGELVRRARTVPRGRPEQLSEAFYAWEKRGRGWDVFLGPVELEPPFRPFVLYSGATQDSVPDDGRRETALSSLARAVRQAVTGAEPEPEREPVPDPEELDPDPTPFETDAPVRELHVALPEEADVKRDVAESLLLSLPRGEGPVAFEVLGRPDGVRIQVACRAPDLPEVRRQLEAHVPGAVLTAEENRLAETWRANGTGTGVVVDFGLSQEFMRPLKVLTNFKTDPLSGIVGALADLDQGERGALQVLFRPVRHRWSEQVLRAVAPARSRRNSRSLAAALRGGARRSFFRDAPEMPRLAREKVSHPLFAVVLRVAARASSESRAWQIARSVGRPLTQLNRPQSNELMPLENQGYPDDKHEEDLLQRRSRRTGMLWNSEELVSLVHPPSAAVGAEALDRVDRATRAAPQQADGGELVLGTNVHAGAETEIRLSETQRLRHTHLIGATGTGKSHLMANLIRQGLERGEGLGVLDPHGDLVDLAVRYVPEERLDDVVLVDVADSEHPVGFNVLRAHSDLERQILASDLTSVFRRLSSSWGDRMDSVLRNAVLAFTESERPGTLFDLKRFLVEPDFRQEFLESVEDPQVRYYWTKEFPQLKGKPQTPLLTRLDRFLSPKPVRYMVCQRESGLDLGSAMEEGKIVLVKLAQGAIGESNASLLGALLVAKFHQLALARQRIRAEERRPFYLYIDEFQHFVTPSMTQVLSEARKYRLGLTLAHQELTQLRSQDPEVASAVLTHPCTRVCFRVGSRDARTLAKGLAHFDAEDLQQLSVGEAVCRVERADADFNLKTHPLPEIDEAAAQRRRAQIVEQTQERYATPREQVASELAVGREAPEPPAAATDGAGRGQPAAEATAEPTAAETDGRRPSKEEEQPAQEAEEPEQPEPGEPPAPMGRGGERHRYLQNLLKRHGEDWGYKATIEQPVLDGAGSVDLALTRDGERVACEVSISSGPDRELENVRKCLEAGFEEVVLVTPEASDLADLREGIRPELDKEDRERVHFLKPDRFLGYLEEREAEAKSGEQRVGGYKLNVNYKTVDEDEKETRTGVVSKIITNALQRLGGDS